MYIRRLYVAIRKQVAIAYKTWKAYCVIIISYLPHKRQINLIRRLYVANQYFAYYMSFVKN